MHCTFRNELLRVAVSVLEQANRSHIYQELVHRWCEMMFKLLRIYALM